ncbi:hypothetical protein CKAH01_08756 [Colletotrichum kahawae]|uniref:Uncharacterized protein n=1 Tax=Colletotrichum kahawae TaxID=34407 RepID=A0AAD9Y1R5_COLKA|nr:hypothetical protein CKAH01_08756 [Colletotrichum kahawae]
MDEMLQSSESHALGPFSKRSWDDVNMGGQSLSMGEEPWHGRAPKHGEERGSQPRRRSYCSIGRTTWCGGMNVTDQQHQARRLMARLRLRLRSRHAQSVRPKLASHAEFVPCRLDSRIGPGTTGVRMSGGGGGRPIASQILRRQASTAELSCRGRHRGGNIHKQTDESSTTDGAIHLQRA